MATLLSALVAFAVPAVSHAGTVFGSFTADMSASKPSGLVPGAASSTTFSHPGAPVLSWDTVGGATTYQVQISRTDSFDAGSLAVDATGVTTTKYVPSIVLANTSYYWRVRAHAGTSRYGTWSDAGDFTKSWTSAPSGLQVFDESDSPATRLTLAGYVSWSAVAGATRYEIQVATASSFSASTVMIKTTLPETKITLPPLPDDEYYWRVRALDGSGNAGAWTAGPSFAKAWAPMTAADAYPADGAVQGDYRAGWNPVDGASHYEAQFATQGGCWAEPGADASMRPRMYGTWDKSAIPAPDVRQYCSLTSDVYETGSNWVDSGMVENWNAIVAAINTSIDAPDDNVREMPGTVNNTDYATHVYWRVRPVTRLTAANESSWTLASDHKVNGRWLETTRSGSTAAMRFQVNYGGSTSAGSRCYDSLNASPSRNGCLVQQTEMLSPSSAGSGSTTMQFPMLRWTPFTGANGYMIQIATDQNFNNIVKQDTRPASYLATFALKDPLPDNAEGTGYWWRVLPCAYNGETYCVPQYYPSAAGIESVWGDGAGARTFVKNAEIDDASLTAISNFAGSMPRLSWARLQGASHYEVQLSRSAQMSDATALKTAARMIVPYLPDAESGQLQNIDDGTWYWRVRSFDRNGQDSDWSDVVSFRKTSATPVLSSPANGAVEAQPVLTWGAVSTAGAYTVQVAANASFTSSVTTYTTTQTSVMPSLVAGNWYWRVKAAQGEYSSPRSLVVVELPSLRYGLSARTVIAGRSFLLTGDLSTGAGVAVNEKVRLQMRGPSGAYADIAARTTGSAGEQGNVSWNRRADSRRYYRLAWRDATGTEHYSAPFLSNVVPKIAARVGRRNVARGKKFTVKVSLNRRVSGRVRFQYRQGNKWVTAKTSTMRRMRSFRMGVRVNRSGTFRTRLVFDRMGSYGNTRKSTGRLRINDLWSFYY